VTPPDRTPVQRVIAEPSDRTRRCGVSLRSRTFCKTIGGGVGSSSSGMSSTQILTWANRCVESRMGPPTVTRDCWRDASHGALRVSKIPAGPVRPGAVVAARRIRDHSWMATGLSRRTHYFCCRASAEVGGTWGRSAARRGPGDVAGQVATCGRRVRPRAVLAAGVFISSSRAERRDPVRPGCPSSTGRPCQRGASWLLSRPQKGQGPAAMIVLQPWWSFDTRDWCP
jgi:hypothetical protein